MCIQCTDDENSDIQVNITDISFIEPSYKIEQGQIYDLKDIVVVTGSDAAKAQSIFSSDESAFIPIADKIVIITEDHILKANNLGSIEIKVVETLTGLSSTTNITVIPAPVPVAGLALNVSNLSLERNESFQIIATITPEDATNKTISWSTEWQENYSPNSTESPETYLIVNSEGLVTGINLCENCVQIIAKSVDGPADSILVNGQATVSEVTPPAGATHQDWMGFTITFTGGVDGGTYTTNATGDQTAVWSASGSWVFTDDSGTKITRDGKEVITLAANATDLHLTFTVDDTPPVAGKIPNSSKWTVDV